MITHNEDPKCHTDDGWPYGFEIKDRHGDRLIFAMHEPSNGELCVNVRMRPNVTTRKVVIEPTDLRELLEWLKGVLGDKT